MLQGVDDLMPIGEFSERSGLSAKRLRTYAAAGLLVPAAVDSASGYRYYAPGQLRDARLIDALRGAGVPLADVATVLREPTVERLDGWARAVEVDTAQRQAALRVARQLLLETDGQPIETTPKDGAMRLHTAARTDIGRVRERNEDAILCSPHVAARRRDRRRHGRPPGRRHGLSPDGRAHRRRVLGSVARRARSGGPRG